MTRPDPSRKFAFAPKVSGLVAFLLGLVDLSVIFAPKTHEFLNGHLEQVPGVAGNAAVLSTVFRGVILVLLADGLVRRKFRAWLFVVATLILTIVGALVVPAWSEQGVTTTRVTSAVLLAFLVTFRKQFYALPDSRSAIRVLRIFIQSSVIALLGALAICSVRLHTLHLPLTFSSFYHNAIPALFGFETHISSGPGRIADLTYYALLGLGMAVVFPTIATFLAAPKPEPKLSPADDFEIRQLLATHGQRDSLGYFALRRDKSVVWSESRKACITYRVTLGVMLASGDPLGDPEAWPGAIEVFLETARQHGWHPAVAGASYTGAQVWSREADLHTLEIGDEAILRVGEFSLDGRIMRNVRQMVNRTYRLGYTATMTRASALTPKEIKELQIAADKWRNGHVERGYSMALGRIGEPQDGQTVIVRAYKDEKLMAFLSFVPWGTDAMSLDFMRRSPECDPGLNELLICSAMESAPELGIEKVSLNFAAFRGMLERGERVGAAPLSRFNRNFIVFVSRWIQIESLYRFNDKFQPTWEPRYILYNGGREFLRAGLAYLEAEGFLKFSLKSRKKV